MNWYDILFAIQNDYLSIEAAIEHAIKEIEKNVDYSDAVYNIASISPNDVYAKDDVVKYMFQLIEMVSDDDKCKTNDKILFVLLKWVFKFKEKYVDPLRVVEIIYDDFNYPISMKYFVRYEPSPYTIIGSLEENIKRLYSNWQDYLRSEEQKYT